MRLTEVNPSRHAADDAASPWRDCPPGALAHLQGLFTDVDDTLTRDGVIEAAALRALQALHAAAIPVIAVTGRPMGWSRAFARDWPVEAIIAENGAVALRRDAAAAGGVRIDYLQDEATRSRNRERMARVARLVQREVPEARLALDSDGRVTDIAIDHGEHAHLGEPAIARVVALMRAAGMRATVSSIHINGWYGDHDKWIGAQWALRLLHGRELANELDRWLYVGDSTNDQVMFEHFALSVGVANLRRFAHQLGVWPAYITEGERGAGFAEVVAALLGARAGR